MLFELINPSSDSYLDIRGAVWEWSLSRRVVQNTVFWGGAKCVKNVSKMRVFHTPPRRTNN